MNINDYIKSAERLEAAPELKEEIMKNCEKKEKRHISKKKIVPILAAAVIGCVSITTVFADEFMGIFHKYTNFEMAITEVNEPQKESVPVFKASLKKWDENAIHELFEKGRTVVESKDYTSDEECDVKGIRKYRKYDDYILCYEDGDISWDAYHVDYMSIADNLLFNHYSDESSDLEIDGLDRQKSIEKADALLAALDIPVYSQKNVIALNKETLIKADICRGENGKIMSRYGETIQEWTEDQEAYLIVYNAECGGEPVSSEYMRYKKPYELGTWTTDGSLIWVVVGKNGIENFMARVVYETSEKVSDVEICSAQEAANIINDKFKKDIANYPTEIDNCRLVYHAADVNGNGEYEMRPYWEFDSVETFHYYTLYPEKIEHLSYYTYFVDAQTGEILAPNGE